MDKQTKQQVIAVAVLRAAQLTPTRPMPNFLKMLLSLAVVIAVFYFTSSPSPTATLVRMGFLAALIGFTLFSLFRRKGKDNDE